MSEVGNDCNPNLLLRLAADEREGKGRDGPDVAWAGVDGASGGHLCLSVQVAPTQQMSRCLEGIDETRFKIISRMLQIIRLSVQKLLGSPRVLTFVYIGQILPLLLS